MDYFGKLLCQVEDGTNFKIIAKILTSVGIKVPTSLEMQAGIKVLIRDAADGPDI